MGVGGPKVVFFRNSTRFGGLVAVAQFFGSPAPGALGRGQKFYFLNMVMWHIKLKGICSRPGYTEKF